MGAFPPPRCHKCHYRLCYRDGYAAVYSCIYCKAAFQRNLPGWPPPTQK